MTSPRTSRQAQCAAWTAAPAPQRVRTQPAAGRDASTLAGHGQLMPAIPRRVGPGCTARGRQPGSPCDTCRMHNATRGRRRAARASVAFVVQTRTGPPPLRNEGKRMTLRRPPTIALLSLAAAVVLLGGCEQRSQGAGNPPLRSMAHVWA